MADDTGSGTGTPEVQMVPSARLREESGKKREALARVGELEAQLSEYEKKVATTDTLAKQIEELKKTHAATIGEWETERAVWQAGITDPEAISVAKHLWSSQDEKARKPFPETLKTWKDKPEEAPRAFRAYLEPAQAPAAPEKGKQAPAPRATGVAPSTGAPAASGQWTVEQIASLREEGQRTGNWDAYKKARSSILAGLSRR